MNCLEYKHLDTIWLGRFAASLRARIFARADHSPSEANAWAERLEAVRAKGNDLAVCRVLLAGQYRGKGRRCAGDIQ